MIGKDGIEKTFDRQFSNRFNIHRTRQNFPEDGIDTFERMAQRGLLVTDRVVKEEIGGTIDEENDTWIIPIEIEYK
jgi:predicted transcriptional regulator